MPLTKIQKDLAKLLSSNRSSDSYLAGGAALHFAPSSKRYSSDLDFFHDSEERVAKAFADDLKALNDAGYSLSIEIKQPGPNIGFFGSVIPGAQPLPPRRINEIIHGKRAITTDTAHRMRCE